MTARAAVQLLALGLFAAALPAAADDYTVHTEHSDQQGTDKTQTITDDTTLDSNRGRHQEDHSSTKFDSEGSHTHEELSGNGTTTDPEGQHWVDDGSNSTQVIDTHTSKDGSSTEHIEQAVTDADGNTEILTRDRGYDSHGKLISESESRRRVPKQVRPEQPTPAEPPPAPRRPPEPPIGNLAGTFTLEQASILGAFQYAGEARLEQGGKGDGESADRAQWTMVGTVTMKTTQFTLGKKTCTLAGEARQAIPAAASFAVDKRARTARWSLGLLSWRYACGRTGSSEGTVATLTFGTRGGAFCSELVDVPVSSPRRPAGSFTMACFEGTQPGIGTVTATWSFGPG
jgi:hypothetical protein